MNMVQLHSIQDFRKKLENPHFLMGGCKIFQQIEHRDVAYIIARRYIENNSSKNDFILAAKMFLLFWNDRLYRANPTYKDLLQDQLSVTYDATFPRIHDLTNIAIDTPDIDKIADTIYELFRICYLKDAIGIVGAAKLLHLLKPDLFMIWDNEIITNYHKLHMLNQNSHIKDSRDLCYVEFLRNCNGIAKAISARTNIEKLQIEHPSYAHFGFKKTLAKMIDECNFTHFTRNRSW